MEKTKYNNLASECLVMIKSFYPLYSVELSDDKKGCHICVEQIMSRSFVILIDSNEHVYNVESGKLFDVTMSNTEISRISVEKDIRYFIKVALNLRLEQLHHKKMPWGILQGIRPIKLVHKIYQKFKLSENKPEGSIEFFQDKILAQLCNEYFVDRKMALLAIEIAINEIDYKPKSVVEAREQFSIYISIPFCPTRCHYCSFPSNTIEQFGHSLYEYLDTVLKEWDSIVTPMLAYRNVSCLYIGGGTPTSLGKDELAYLLKGLSERIDFKYFREITVEAGRPDTITLEKLLVLKQHGVERISINPQTMHQKTLDIIGRKHTVQQIIEAYKLALSVGIKRINMDLIIGLPGETKDDVMATIQSVCDLNPTEITVHTLAIKRSSIVKAHMEAYQLPSELETNAMVEWSIEYLKSQMGYKPYYLYRQKNMVGSHENIGYFKSDTPCIYNIEIMEEVMPIIALGAGAISKEIDSNGNPIRSENVKNVQNYMDRIDDMIERKKVMQH